MRTLWNIIVKTVNTLWRIINFIRECILNLFLVVILLLAVGVWSLFSDNDHPSKNSFSSQALTLDLSGVLVDKPVQNQKLTKLLGREFFGTNTQMRQENSLFDLVTAIRQAKADPAITGLVLDLHNFAGGDLPALNYLGKALAEFRAVGKPIYAYQDNYSQAQYYLASYANQLVLSPQGAVDLHGMATNGLYFKGLLDKLRVSSHVFRVGTYKSAVEPFLRNDMSPEARAADSDWLNQLWQGYLTTVAANRKSTAAQIFPDADTQIAQLSAAQGDTARYAIEHHLVDSLQTPAQMEQELVKKFGWDDQQKTFRQISIYNYSDKTTKKTAKPNIAVVVVNGAITDGPSSDDNVGGDTTAQQIRTARLDPQIKAIILRVNSPGGSVTASEKIREELVAAKQAGKSIVVSMGGLAASGGYWISTPADSIIASSTTLTGSIGIFGVINTLENTLNTFGVHTDGVTTSPLADVATTKALPDHVAKLMQLTVNNGYQRFITLVAESRHQTPKQINEIGQGRVWTGSDARKNGLVDALGDFDDAVAKAQQLAQLSSPSLQWVEDEPSWIDLLAMQLQVSSRLSASIQAWLPAPLRQVVTQVSTQPGLFNHNRDPQNRYAWCINCGVIN